MNLNKLTFDTENLVVKKKIKNKIENPEEEIRLKIRNKTFLNETTLN